VLVMLFSLLSLFFVVLVIGILFHILVKFGLVMKDMLFVVLFVFNKVFTLGLNFVDKILLFSDNLFISFFQVFDSFLQ